MTVYKAQTHQGRDGQWYVRVGPKKGGRIVLQSEGYTRKASAERLAKTLTASTIEQP